MSVSDNLNVLVKLHEKCFCVFRETKLHFYDIKSRANLGEVTIFFVNQDLRQYTPPLPFRTHQITLLTAHAPLNSCFTRLYKHTCIVRLLCLQPVLLFTHLLEPLQHFNFLISIAWHIYFITFISWFSFIEKNSRSHIRHYI